MAKLNDFMSSIDLSMLEGYCREHGHSKSYRRGDRLVEEGRMCRHIGIVKSGYFKYTILSTAGEECVTGFSFAGEIVGDFVRSFLYNRPAMTSIIAGRDAEVIQVPIADARPYILSRNPSYCSDASAVLLTEAYRRYLSVHKRTPAERYSDLRHRFGHVIDTITNSDLASYLTISRRQFQRIRENYAMGQMSRNKS